MKIIKLKSGIDVDRLAESLIDLLKDTDTHDEEAFEARHRREELESALCAQMGERLNVLEQRLESLKLGVFSLVDKINGPEGERQRGKLGPYEKLKEEVRVHASVLDGYSQRVSWLEGTAREHDRQLKLHTDVMGEQRVILDKHGDRLDDIEERVASLKPKPVEALRPDLIQIVRDDLYTLHKDRERLEWILARHPELYSDRRVLDYHMAESTVRPPDKPPEFSF